MQRRTTIWIAGLWSLIYGAAAHGLGLGDIEVYSALNQPLEAEIMLTSVRPGETDGMLVKLAGEEAFTQAGIDRPFYLTKIKFRLATKPDGTQYILVTTDNAVKEPFISFLIDIDWPRGHLVREYTILLDPPVFTTDRGVAQTVPAQEMPTDLEVQDFSEFQFPDIEAESAAGEPALIRRDAAMSDLPDIEMLAAAELEQTTDTSAFVERPVEGTAAADVLFQDVPDADFGDALDSGDSSLSERLQQPLPDIDLAFDESLPYDVERTNALLAEFSPFAVGAKSDTRSTSGDSRSDSYKVQAGDTLWEIATQHKDADVSVQQAMLAILRYNPNAFIRNNINDVKKGFVLRMPEREAMLEISRAEAAAEAQRQYALWREYRGELAGITSAPQDAVVADRLAQADRIKSATTDTAVSGQLSILAPGRDAESTARSSGAQEGKETGSAANLDLQLAREQLEAERLEKSELQSRLTDLGDQVDKMQRLLSLKDEQLAKLQNRLRELETTAAMQQPAAVPEPVPAELAPALDPAADVKAEKTAPVESQKVGDKTAATSPDSPASPDNTAVKIVEIDKPIESQTEVAGTPPQTDTNKKKPAPYDIEKLDESFDISLQEKPRPVAGDSSEPAVTAADKTENDKPAAAAEAVPGKPLPKQLDAVLKQVQGILRDLFDRHLPSPYNRMATDLLETPAGLGILVALLIVVIVLVVVLLKSLLRAKPKKAKTPKVIIGSSEHLQASAITQVDTTRFVAKKAGLNERLKNVFAPFSGMFARKPKAEAATFEDEEIIEDEMVAADEDLASAVQEAAVEVKSRTKPQRGLSIADSGETVKVKAATLKPAAAAEPEEEIADDTTAEADVYLAYGLFDQAEELLKQALAGNPSANHYRGKLLETYFAAAKKDEFERLAAEVHKSIGNKSSRIWDKAVAMGKEIAPGNPLFSGAADSGLKASDFAPAKPETADLDLGEAGGMTTPDIDFGDDAESASALDLDVSGSFETTLIADSEETMISDSDRTVIADDLAFELPGSGRDVTDSELNINFDADDLGLGSELEIDEADSTVIAEPESTMAMDMGLDIDNFDMDGITDVDGGASSGTFNARNSAGDDLIAELGGNDDSELSLDEASSDTEFDISEEDDTIIDAGDDTFSGDLDSGSDEDEVSTKLDLAKAYMDMGDYDGASSTLEEVLAEGSQQQKQEAEELLDQIK